MNYYGSPKHKEILQDYDARVFSHCDFSKPSAEYSPGNEYLIRCYDAEDDSTRTILAVSDSGEILKQYASDCGQISRLYFQDRFIFEWKYLGGDNRKATIIQHANGKTYLLYYEDLYGYSVLDLSSMQSVSYIPQESQETDQSLFRETVIWAIPHYDPESSLLAVEGCIWAAPYTVVVVDFSDPMRIVEARQWVDLGGDIDSDSYDEVNFNEWNKDSLVCDTGVFSKSDLFRRIMAH